MWVFFVCFGFFYHRVQKEWPLQGIYECPPTFTPSLSLSGLVSGSKHTVIALIQFSVEQVCFLPPLINNTTPSTNAPLVKWMTSNARGFICSHFLGHWTTPQNIGPTLPEGILDPLLVFLIWKNSSYGRKLSALTLQVWNLETLLGVLWAGWALSGCLILFN